MKPELKIHSRNELFQILADALIKKQPEPPAEWSAAKLDEEISRAGKVYDPSPFIRHRDAIRTAVFYLVDFARRMPDWINLSTETVRVQKICGDLAVEIERMTEEPEAVIAEGGKLKAQLTAILAVETCLIYREETERVIREEERLKHLRRAEKPVMRDKSASVSPPKQWQSALAQKIFQKVSGTQNKVSGRQETTEQPSLF